jgi:hypothetical protein
MKGMESPTRPCAVIMINLPSIKLHYASGSAPDERPAPSQGAEAAHVEVLDVRTVLAESV